MKEKEERERTSAWKESLSMGDKGSLVALQVAALKNDSSEHNGPCRSVLQQAMIRVCHWCAHTSYLGSKRDMRIRTTLQNT